jgi:hypothetical protein
MFYKLDATCMLSIKLTPLQNGTITTASANTNTDLFFALKGGLNRFAIVTSIVYKTHPQPPQIYVSNPKPAQKKPASMPSKGPSSTNTETAKFNRAANASTRVTKQTPSSTPPMSSPAQTPTPRPNSS